MKKQRCRREYYLQNRAKILAQKKKYYENNKYIICYNIRTQYTRTVFDIML